MLSHLIKHNTNNIYNGNLCDIDCFKVLDRLCIVVILVDYWLGYDTLSRIIVSTFDIYANRRLIGDHGDIIM